MPSTFAWLDNSDQQRRKVLDMLAMFKERETVDELGLGTIRDAFADLLFPGTSAPQTRARYFLFVPWMYQHFEKKKTSSTEIAKRARRFELDLIEALLNAGEADGVIGRLARRGLQRLPSNIYWSGLVRLGVFGTELSQDRYHASLDGHYRRSRDLRMDDGDSVDGRRGHWHPRLPPPPERFEVKPALALSVEEAEYLRLQIQMSAPQSLFAALVREHAVPKENFPWENVLRVGYSPEIWRQLDHAQRFSEVMHGAALLYNLILGELSQQEERVAEYTQRLAEWASLLEARPGAVTGWDLNDMWQCIGSEGARIGTPTKTFVTEWCREALQRPDAIAHSKAARFLVESRERRLKGKSARVVNQRARERWGGAAGTLRLSYRWLNARRIAADIIAPAQGHGNA